MPALGNPIASSYNLTGVTDAQHPALGGTVLQDKLESLNLAAVDSRNAGQDCQLQARIVRSSQTGLLDFYFRITGLGTTPAYLQQAILYNLAEVKGLVLTYADFRVDGLGTIAPSHFKPQLPANGNTSPANRTFAFDFDQSIPDGAGTRFFFISTNAKAFTQGSLTFVFATGNPKTPGMEVFVAGPSAP